MQLRITGSKRPRRRRRGGEKGTVRGVFDQRTSTKEESSKGQSRMERERVD
jgi:hypothetical protein